MADDAPVLLCYDGSDHAKTAIAKAAALVTGRAAVVLAVWQPVESLPSFAWGGGIGLAGLDLERLDQEAADRARQLAEEGAGIAGEAGLAAEAATARAGGPIWDAIIQAADERDAAVVVLGARGLTGLRHMLLGSVSEGVARYSGRPTLVIGPDRT